MARYLIDNNSGVIKREKSVFSITRYFMTKSLRERKPLALKMIVDFRFFDSLRDILKDLKKMFDEDLLKSFRIIIASDTALNPKEFLFKLKTDAIILDKDDFYILNILNNAGVLRFRVNYKSMINTRLYMIEYNGKTYSYIGSCGFSGGSSNSSIDLLAPVVRSTEKPNEYRLFFRKIWKISDTRVNNTRIINHLKNHAAAEVINLNPRNFIAVTLKSIAKDYLVRNISTDLSQLSEFKNMGYYSCIEKMNKYGSVIFANSIGLSELYISSMIIKFYFEKNLKTLVICSADSEPVWEQNFTKTGLKKSFAQFINRSEFQKNQFNADEYQNLNLIVIDNAEYFSISKDRNNRKCHLEKVLNNNPNAHILMISRNIINDSLSDLVTIYRMFSRGRYASVMIEEGVDEAVHKLSQDIEKGNINYETVETIKHILNTFMVKIEWTNMDAIIDPLQQDLNKPSITTVKYAYDHEISMKIYEKLIPTISEFKFEYSKLKFSSYYEDANLTNWYKWRLCRTIESSLLAFLESAKRLLNKTEFTLKLITGSTELSHYKDLFNEDQIFNIKHSFNAASDDQKNQIINNLNADILTLNNFFASSTAIKYLENRDEKVTSLLKIINTESKPTVIFSESDDTIAYIKRRLLEYGNVKSEVITGELVDIDGDDIQSSKSGDIDEICTRFEAGEFNILITNDAIAEDIKLPRAKVIINFDMPINPSSLSKRNRIASLQPHINKTKIYNFQSDRRVDREIMLFETIKVPLHELIAYYGIDFILWCIDERHVENISESKISDYYLLTKEYKDFFAKKNTDEIKSKFAPSLSSDDLVLREFIKYLNISEETLKLSVSNFKKPIYTSLKSDYEHYYVIYKTTSGIKISGKLSFSALRTESAFTETDLKAVISIVEDNISRKNEGNLIFIIGIIRYEG